VDATAILTNTYDATDRVVGWTSDHAGNLTGDGTTNGQSRAYTYNGDGLPAAENANGITTYTEDPAADKSRNLAGMGDLTNILCHLGNLAK
jgi:YD repeat-containing protein